MEELVSYVQLAYYQRQIEGDESLFRMFHISGIPSDRLPPILILNK